MMNAMSGAEMQAGMDAAALAVRLEYVRLLGKVEAALMALQNGLATMPPNPGLKTLFEQGQAWLEGASEALALLGGVELQIVFTGEDDESDDDELYIDA